VIHELVVLVDVELVLVADVGDLGDEPLASGQSVSSIFFSISVMIPFVLLAPESARAARFCWHYATNKIRKDSAVHRVGSRGRRCSGILFIFDGFWAGILRFFFRLSALILRAG
jgi:hypothetical protein